MNIIDLFDEFTGGISVYKLRELEEENFKSKLPIEFRRCYISDSDILNSINKGFSFEQIIQSVLPTKENIKSGEFGEILAFLFLPSKYATHNFQDFRKWQLKTDKDKPMFHSDVILYTSEQDPLNDVLVSAEVKTRATRSHPHALARAIQGANDDRTTRMIEGLIQLKDNFVKNGDMANYKRVDRFFKTDLQNRDYTRIHVAIAIVDDTLVEKEQETPLPENNNLDLMLISTRNLCEMYKEIFSRTSKTNI